MAGPLTELERWCSNQRVLVDVTDQLKTKESKAVLGALVLAKSKLMKKWKALDAW